jgi:hypothetical protein
VHKYLYVGGGGDGLAAPPLIYKVAAGSGAALPTWVATLALNATQSRQQVNAIAVDGSSGYGWAVVEDRLYKFSLGVGDAAPVGSNVTAPRY